MRDTFGNLFADHLNYMRAYHLCEEILLALMAAIAAMWGSIIWMRKQDAARQTTAIQMLIKLIATIEAQPRVNICKPETPDKGAK